MNALKLKKNQKGFTLMEMLIVVAIIAVLVAILIPTVSKSLNKSKEATDIANLRAAYAEAQMDYMSDPNCKEVTFHIPKMNNAGTYEADKTSGTDGKSDGLITTASKDKAVDNKVTSLKNSDTDQAKRVGWYYAKASGLIYLVKIGEDGCFQAVSAVGAYS